MTISFRCSCNQDLEVDDEFAGQEVSCPTCGRVVVAPAKRRVAKPLVIAPPPKKSSGTTATSTRSGETPTRKPKSVSSAFDQVEDRPRRRPRDDEDEDEPRPKKKRKKKKKPAPSGGPNWSAVGGGALFMFLAVVWFVGALVFLDRIFFYPPIMFVLGLLGMVGGFMGGGDEDDDE